MSRYIKIVVFSVLLMFTSTLRANLVAEYLFEEGAGTATGDTGGLGNNADFIGDVVWVSGCNSSLSKYALYFSGSSYVKVEDSASLDTITNGFSLTAWIKVASDSTVVSKLGAFRIWKQNSNLMVTLQGVPAVTNYTVINGQIPNNIWVHIAVTYDGKNIAGYVNGTRTSNFRANNDITPIATSNNPLLIGSFGSTYYHGSMDNMRIYNHSLSYAAAEVTADMNRIGFFSSVPLSVVQGGTAKTAIIVPDGTIEDVISVAATELQYHINKATGITLQIYPESSKPTTYAGLIYVGRCNATQLVGIQGSNLDLNGYILRSYGPDLFLAGRDNFGTALGALHLNRTQIGTMLAVYQFLEKYMDVKWLWPGVSGEVIPHHDGLAFSNINIIGKPVLTNTNLIDTNADWGWGADNYSGWTSDSVRQAFLNDQSLWMRRQGFCQATDLTNYGHSMEDWWDKYGISHPEYFSLLPDGTRRPDSLYYGGPGYLVAFCLSQPNVWKQIVDDWVVDGASGMIKCGITDAPTVCTCANCMAWDVPDPDLTIPWADRLTYATNSFNSSDTEWYKYLGRMSDRYAKFILAVQQEAVSRGYANAEVFGFAYTNRYKAPLQTQLNKRVTLGVVPPLYFPLTWNDENKQVFRDSWNGWIGTDGANAFLRPNDFLSGHNMQIFTARRFGPNFIYALRRGMIATNFDSLTGQWASQAVNFYMLARVQTHIDSSSVAWGSDLNGDATVDLVDLAMFSQQWLDDQVICLANITCPDFNGDGKVDFVDFAELSNNWNGGCKDVEAILNDFYGAFGPAAIAVKAYFDYWENVSDNTTIYGGYHEFYKTAPQIFTPAIMSNGRTLMIQAQQAATGDAVAERLVGFLEKGLTHAEITLDTQAAWEEYQRTGVVGPWTTALQNLDSYRASVESDGICNMGFLYWAETFNWRL